MVNDNSLELLNKAQKEAVVTSNGYVRIIAGAGSGKTRVLTQRIAYLLEEGKCQPYEILAITFTNKAAAEMKERIENIVGDAAHDIWVMTYHAFCARILRYHINLLGYDNTFNILDSADQKAVLKTIYKKIGVKSQEYSPAMVLSHISNYKMARMTAQDIEKIIFTAEEKVILQIFVEYQKYLAQQKVLDFDDLLLKTLELFEKHPDVLEKYSGKFKYIHVDEFQDTNDVQFRLIELLSQTHKHLYIVGDPDQSIYGWRGANDALILGFDQKFSDVQTITLEQNYRSTQTILDAANILIEHNSGRLAKNLFSENNQGNAITVFEANDEKNEADFVAIKINTLVREQGEEAYGNVAILYRANYLSRAIEEGFIRHGVPYIIYGDTRFLDRKEIKDMHAYMHLVVNPQDDISFIRVINEPKRNVGEKTLEKLQVIADQHNFSLFEALDIVVNQAGKGKAKQWLAEFQEFILEGKAKLDELSLANFLDYIYVNSGYENMLKNDETQLGRIDNIAELKTSLTEYQNKIEEDLTTTEIAGQYLQEMALLSSNDKKHMPFTVSLMTVHAAKGLEFDSVFIIGMNEDIFPSRRSTEEGNLEEERRLAYVAITRAREQLYVSFANGINQITKTLKQASSFLYEARLLENRNNPMFEKTPAFIQSKPKKNMQSMSFRKEGETNSFAVSDKVRHKKFGEGVIVSIDGKMIIVAFAAEFGIKNLVANFIEKI